TAGRSCGPPPDGYARSVGDAGGVGGAAGAVLDERKAEVRAELDHRRVATESGGPVEDAAGPPVRRMLLLNDCGGELPGDDGPVGGVRVGASRACAVHDNHRPAVRGEFGLNVAERCPHRARGRPVPAAGHQNPERCHGASFGWPIWMLSRISCPYSAVARSLIVCAHDAAFSGVGACTVTVTVQTA